MLVKDRMTRNPIHVTPDTAVAEALSMMRQHKVRRLPVLNKKGRLEGMVSEKDLLYASPSPATSLNVYEIGYLLSKLKIKEIMSQSVITIDENAPLEDAAKLMVDNGISGLPVMRKDELVGIITETDIFKTFLEMLGAREEGIRLTLRVRDEPGMLSLIAGTIAGAGGDIVALGTFYGEAHDEAILIAKVCCVEQGVLLDALKAANIDIVDVRVP